MQVKIAPSLLAADFTNLGEAIRVVDEAGADIHHLDIMDGRFVPNISFGPMIVETVKKITKLPLDVHLMIVEPEKYIERFREAGADWITVHIEECAEPLLTIKQIKSTGAKAGISLNPGTPVEKIFPLLKVVDLILLMSVNPGFGGQSFIADTLEKAYKLSIERRAKNYKYQISMDGGVGVANAGMIVESGVDILVAGTSIYKAESPKNAIAEIRKAANHHGWSLLRANHNLE